MKTNIITNWWKKLTFYVILDPSDNSVTLSRALFKYMYMQSKSKCDKASVFVSYSPELGCYAFTPNPDNIHVATQMCDIQYNTKLKCIGFETLCPSVGSILYRYGLSHETKIKTPVSIITSSDGITHYIINRPNDNKKYNWQLA